MNSRRVTRRNAVAPFIPMMVYDRIVPNTDPAPPESPGGTVDLTECVFDREPLSDITNNLYWTGPVVLPTDAVADSDLPIFTDAPPPSDVENKNQVELRRQFELQEQLRADRLVHTPPPTPPQHVYDPENDEDDEGNGDWWFNVTTGDTAFIPHDEDVTEYFNNNNTN